METQMAKENIISGGLFEKDGPAPLVEGPLPKGREKIPVGEYERFLRALWLKESPLERMWVDGMWTYLGMEGRPTEAFRKHILAQAKLALDTELKKTSAKYGVTVEVDDMSAKAKLFRAACMRSRTQPGGKPW